MSKQTPIGRALAGALLAFVVAALVALGPAAAVAAAAPSATAPPATARPATATSPPGAASGAAGNTATAAGGAGSPNIPLPAGPGTAPVSSTGANQPLSGRAKAAAVLGGLLLIGVLWAFSQGYGLLGGRARPRAMPGRDRTA